MNKIRYTREQLNIIHHQNKPALVNAGPGTGKSATLIGKIKHELDKGLKPTEIVVLTFSKNAKKDFVARLQKQLGSIADDVNVHTLHSFGLFVIQQHYQKLGFTSRPTGTKNKVVRNSKQYVRTKLDANKVDYNDMLAMPLQLFAQRPAILKKVSRQFSCLLVDELQDINQQQAQLIELLANKIRNTILVGDKKQLIYRFRGASIKFLDHFVEQLNPKLFSLTRTFRIPKASLPFVNGVGGSFSDDKPLVSSIDGHKPSLYRFTDSDAQANYIAQEIQRLLKLGVDINGIACLSRTNISLQQLKLALETRGIEVVESNYSSSIAKWIRILKSLIYITRWIASKHYPAPNNSINRIIKLASIPIEEHEFVFDKIINDGISGLKMKRSSSKSKQHDNRLERIGIIRKAIVDAAEQSDTQAAIQILIDVLMTFIRRRDGRCKYQIQRELSRIKLQVRGLKWDEIKIKELELDVTETGVTLSTIHGAKGKEWPYVFLIHVTEDEFSQDKDDYELMYTAMTRHSWKLYLLETPRKNNLFNKEGKLLRKTNLEESSIIAPYVKYVKDFCYKK